MNSTIHSPNEIEENTASGYYRNFRQPLKLAWRMLTSRNRAAVSAVVHQALKIVATPIDWNLAGKESRRLQKNNNTQLPILLVVGAPRSGTTLIYQTIAQFCNISYFANLTAMFPQSPITATRLWCYPFQPPHTSFESFYGYMPRLSDPNDGFAIWNRWLGSDRYSTPSRLSEKTANDMRQFFRAWTTTFGLPLVNKNNRNTTCIELLAETLPEARFVIVRRDSQFVAQSLIHARKNIQGDKRVGWGLHSREVNSTRDPLGYVDDICDQLIEIENQLQTQLLRVDPARVYPIQYETFCRSPLEFLESLGDSIPEIALNNDLIARHLSSFDISSSKTVSDSELTRIKLRLSHDLASA